MTILPKKLGIINSFRPFSYKIFLKLIVFMIILTAISNIVVMLIIQQKPQLINSYNDISLLIDSLLVLIYGPIIEEILCRLWLSPSKRNLIISFVVWIYVFTKAICLRYDEPFTLFILVSLLLIILVSILVARFRYRFFTKNFSVFYILSTVVFAFMHLGNYENINQMNPILMSVLVLPQLCAGVIFAYTRVTYGFIYAILLHSISNLFPLILKLLLVNAY